MVLVERHARDLSHEIENLVDEAGGSCRGDVSRPQYCCPVFAGQAVEVGEVNDENLPQANKRADPSRRRASGSPE